MIRKKEKIKMQEKDRNNLKKRIENDEDFIYCPKLGNSLKRLLQTVNDSVSDSRIQRVLLLTEEELRDYYNSALVKLREYLESN